MSLQYKRITAEEAKEIIDSKESITILDVRTLEEYNGGHIENAILIPVTEIKNSELNFLTDKNVKILVYCRSGVRSEAASLELIERGYTDVTDFGGIISWNYETVR